MGGNHTGRRNHWESGTSLATAVIWRTSPCNLRSFSAVPCICGETFGSHVLHWLPQLYEGSPIATCAALVPSHAFAFSGISSSQGGTGHARPLWSASRKRLAILGKAPSYIDYGPALAGGYWTSLHLDFFSPSAKSTMHWALSHTAFGKTSRKGFCSRKYPAVIPLRYMYLRPQHALSFILPEILLEE